MSKRTTRILVTALVAFTVLVPSSVTAALLGILNFTHHRTFGSVLGQLLAAGLGFIGATVFLIMMILMLTGMLSGRIRSTLR